MDKQNVSEVYKLALAEVKEKFELMKVEIEKQKQVSTILQKSLLDQHEKKNEKEALLDDARTEFVSQRDKTKELQNELEVLRRENAELKEKYVDKDKNRDKVIANEEKQRLAEQSDYQDSLKQKYALKYSKSKETTVDALGRTRPVFEHREVTKEHGFVKNNVNQKTVNTSTHMYKEQLNTIYKADKKAQRIQKFENVGVTLKAAQKIGVETVISPFQQAYQNQSGKLKESIVNYLVKNEFEQAVAGERQPYRSKTTKMEKMNKMVFDREASVQKLNQEPKSKLISRSLAYATKNVANSIKSSFSKHVVPALTTFVQKKKERFQEIKKDVSVQKENNKLKTQDKDRAM